LHRQIQDNNNTKTGQKKYLEIMTKKELRILRKNLPKGYRDTLARQFNCTASYVDKVLSGTRNNIEMIKAATKMAEDYKAEMDQLSNQIKQL
jgi:transcriptional regulator with XRE-family HTH domain